MKCIPINTCEDCPHLSHTGMFTRGGAKPCCDHGETCKLKGYNCFKRVLKKFPKIPSWCPL